MVDDIKMKSGLAYQQSQQTFTANTSIINYPAEAVKHSSNPRNFLARARVDYVKG